MKRTYIGGIVFAIGFITASAIVMTPSVRAKNVPCEDFTVVDEEFTTEDMKVGETGQIREDSGMPCINPEQFRRWYADYSTSAEGDGDEQETGEETEGQSDGETSEEGETSETACDETAVLPGVGEDLPEETVSEDHAVYAINDDMLNPDIQAYLYQRLADHGIEWFMPYAIMIAYQESHFDQHDVSDDGKDYGLLQFRAEFWDWNRGDIFDPYAQIDVFAENMANRANMGLDVYEMISRHMQSDWGSYNHEYVSDVLSHATNLREVSK